MPEFWVRDLTEEEKKELLDESAKWEKRNIEALFYTVLGSLLLGFLILLAATYYSSPSHHL